MGVLYIGSAILILLVNYDKIGWAFGQILDGAFTGLGVAGGLVSALIQGFKRAAFSNEAGVGSAAIAHSAVRTSEPITEGLVSLLEPLIDTVVICTLTALVITISGQLIIDPATGQYMFCVFVVIGASASLGSVIDFSDAAIFAMAVVNITGLYFLMDIVRKELASYGARLASGEIKRFKNI